MIHPEEFASLVVEFPFLFVRITGGGFGDVLFDSFGYTALTYTVSSRHRTVQMLYVVSTHVDTAYESPHGIHAS